MVSVFHISQALKLKLC